MKDKSTVHGDVHLRNVLVRDGRGPHLIDYANCGPGHPCFDLVRMEYAIQFYSMQMTGDEGQLAALFVDILSGGTAGDIAASHPALCASRTNRLAVHAGIVCRRAAVRNAVAFGGTEDDYLAMKFVVCCQSLLMLDFQSGVVRAYLAALGSVLRDRPIWRRTGERPFTSTV